MGIDLTVSGGDKADGSRRWVGDYQFFFPAYAHCFFC